MPAFEARPVTMPTSASVMASIRQNPSHRGLSFAEEYLKRCAERRQEPYYPWVAGAKDRVMDVDCEFMQEDQWVLVLSALRTSTVASYHRIRLACFENMGPRHPPKQSRRLVAYEALAAVRAPRLPPMQQAAKLVSGLSHQIMLSAVTLKELRLCGIPIGPEGAVRLATSIALTTGLRDLQLDGSGIGNTGLAELVPVLKRLPELTTVSLRRCGLTCAAADDLGRLAAGTVSSKHWEQTLRNDQVAHYTNGRSSSPHPPHGQHQRLAIASLALAENSVGDVVVGKIFREEVSRSCLKWLDLSGTAVTADAGQLLLRMVSASNEESVLSFVDLSNTQAAGFFVSGPGASEVLEGVHVVVAASGFNKCQLLRTNAPSSSATAAAPRPRTTKRQSPLPLEARNLVRFDEHAQQHPEEHPARRHGAALDATALQRSLPSSRSPSAPVSAFTNTGWRRGGQGTMEDELFLMVDSPPGGFQHAAVMANNGAAPRSSAAPTPSYPTPLLPASALPVPGATASIEVQQLFEAYGRRIRELESVVAGYAALNAPSLTMTPGASLPALPDAKKFAEAVTRSRKSPAGGPGATSSRSASVAAREAAVTTDVPPASLQDLAQDAPTTVADGVDADVNSRQPSEPGADIREAAASLANDRKHLDPVLPPGDIAVAVKQEVEHALEESERAHDETVATMAKFVMEAMESMQAHTAEANARLEAKLIDQSLALSKLQRQLEEERHLRDDAQAALALHFKEETRKAAEKGSTKIVVVPATEDMMGDSVSLRSKKSLESCIEKVLDNLQATLGVAPTQRPNGSAKASDGPPSNVWVDTGDAPPKPISAQVRLAARENDVKQLTVETQKIVKEALAGLQW